MNVDLKKNQKLNTGKYSRKRSGNIFVTGLLLLTIFLSMFMSVQMLPEKVSAATPKTTVTKRTLYVGYTDYQIKVKNLSSKATVTYISSNNEVAKVTKTGLIQPVAKGSATVTVTIKQSGETYTSKIAVTVKNPYLSIPHKEKILVQSSDFKLTGKAYGLADPVFTFTSSNTRVAKVDKNTGMIHARSAGMTKITMTDTTSGKSVSFTLTVVERTEANADQVYVSTEGFRSNYTYTAPEDVSGLSDEEVAEVKYLTDIQKRITDGNSITLMEMTDYVLYKSMEVVK